MRMRGWMAGLLVAGLSGGASGLLHAYPIDGYAETGIARLEGYRLAKEGKVPGNRLRPGAWLTTDQVRLRMQQYPDFTLPDSDPGLARKIVRLLGEDAKNYSVSVLDLSDPEHPLFAEHNPHTRRNPGSVGKLMVVLGVFQALADLYPDDIEARKRILKNTLVTADDFIRTDHHKVPFWKPEINRMPRRSLQEGDTANLWSYLDWMLSASSNAAASMVIRELLLLRHFGTAFPVSAEQEQAFFRDTPRAQLHELMLDSLLKPVTRNGLDVNNLRQGSFFTAWGQRHVPGTNSICTTHELMRYLVHMEQGRLVDAWSSLQIKRLMYMTQWRIRYASSPALSRAAVYFKSGSLYRCKPEPGYQCVKYKGNRDNLMNSVAIVESPAGDPKLYYLVTLTSNVLKKNSAVAHQTFATRLHALLKGLHSAPAGAK